MSSKEADIEARKVEGESNPDHQILLGVTWIQAGLLWALVMARSKLIVI